MTKRQKAYLYLIITTTAWGSSYVAGKYVMESIPSFTLLFLRYSVAVIILTVLYKRGSHQKIQKGDMKYLLSIGFFGYFGAIGLQLTGVHLCDASLASLINSINPIAIIVMAMLILKEKATLHKIIAVIITILGAAVIIGHIQGGSALLGAVLSVASVLLWSVSSVLIRFVSSKYDTLTITLFSMSVAICCSFIVSTFQIARAGTTWSVITPGFVTSILYLGIVCTFMAMFLWNKSLSMVDAATCSLFYPIQPLVSTLLGVALLGESITLNFILGGIMIAGGILYAVMMDSKAPDVKITGQVRERDAQEKP